MDTAIATPAPVPRAPQRQLSWAWLGTLPFFVFVFAFLLFPALTILSGSFRGRDGAFTLENIVGLFESSILESYRVSIEVSVLTAIVGAVMGTLLAYAISWGGLQGRVRSGVITFSSVAANFGGIPLAFAFITLMGRTGALPGFLKNTFGIDLYGSGFSIYTVQGLMLAYVYFQFPLMVLIMVPAFDGLKSEWREAAANLGGGSLDFWRYVGIPILLPSFLGATVLLFGNAFGAYATAEALTGSQVDVVTRVISRQIRGDVLYNPGLSYALAMGMVVILAISTTLYVWLQRVTTRWLRQ
jgi:putative spermidine/putrescine transport system permease protein